MQNNNHYMHSYIKVESIHEVASKIKFKESLMLINCLNLLVNFYRTIGMITQKHRGTYGHRNEKLYKILMQCFHNLEAILYHNVRLMSTKCRLLYNRL